MILRIRQKNMQPQLFNWPIVDNYKLNARIELPKLNSTFYIQWSPFTLVVLRRWRDILHIILPLECKSKQAYPKFFLVFPPMC